MSFAANEGNQYDCRRPQVPNTTHLTPADARRNDAWMDAPGWMAATNGQPTPRTWAEKEQRKALWMKRVAITCGSSEAVWCERLRPTASRRQHLSTQDPQSAGVLTESRQVSTDGWPARIRFHRAEQAQNGISRPFRQRATTATSRERAKSLGNSGLSGEPPRNRTENPQIKSQPFLVRPRLPRAFPSGSLPFAVRQRPPVDQYSISVCVKCVCQRMASSRLPPGVPDRARGST